MSSSFAFRPMSSSLDIQTPVISVSKSTRGAPAVTMSFSLVGVLDPMERTMLHAMLPEVVNFAWDLADIGVRELGARAGCPPGHVHLIVGRWDSAPNETASFTWAGPAVVVQLDRVRCGGQKKTAAHARKKIPSRIAGIDCLPGKTMEAPMSLISGKRALLWPKHLVAALAHEFLHLRQMGRAPRAMDATLSKPVRHTKGWKAWDEYYNLWFENEALWLDARTARALGLPLSQRERKTHPLTQGESTAWRARGAGFRAWCTRIKPYLRDLKKGTGSPASFSKPLDDLLRQLWPVVTGRRTMPRLSHESKMRFILGVGEAISEWMEPRSTGQKAVWLGHAGTASRVLRGIPRIMRANWNIPREGRVAPSWRPPSLSPHWEAQTEGVFLFGLAQQLSMSLAGKIPLIVCEPAPSSSKRAARRAVR